MDQNSQNTVLINNSRTTWPSQILMPFLSSILRTIYYKMHILLFKKVLIIIRDRAQNMLILG